MSKLQLFYRACPKDYAMNVMAHGWVSSRTEVRRGENATSYGILITPALSTALCYTRIGDHGTRQDECSVIADANYNAIMLIAGDPSWEVKSADRDMYAYNKKTGERLPDSTRQTILETVVPKLEAAQVVGVILVDKHDEGRFVANPTYFSMASLAPPPNDAPLIEAMRHIHTTTGLSTREVVASSLCGYAPWTTIAASNTSPRSSSSLSSSLSPPPGAFK